MDDDSISQFELMNSSSHSSIPDEYEEDVTTLGNVGLLRNRILNGISFEMDQFEQSVQQISLDKLSPLEIFDQSAIDPTDDTSIMPIDLLKERLLDTITTETDLFKQSLCLPSNDQNLSQISSSQSSAREIRSVHNVPQQEDPPDSLQNSLNALLANSALLFAKFVQK